MSFDTKRAVVLRVGHNFGSTVRWMSVAEPRDFLEQREVLFGELAVGSGREFLFKTWMAPRVMVDLSATVSIERTSKPVVWAIDAMNGAWLSVLRKEYGSPVSMTLPTMPLPIGTFRGQSGWRRYREIFFPSPVTRPRVGE